MTALYWSEPGSTQSPARGPDVVDLAFRIHCPRLPVDHALALARAVHRVLPWLPQVEGAGVHPVHVAESANGWQRPEHGELALPRRTRLKLRLPRRHLAEAEVLVGETLVVLGHPLEVSSASVLPLVPSRAVFARHVAAPEDDEGVFVERIAATLVARNIRPMKLLCGRRHALADGRRSMAVRSVLVGELGDDESLRLQAAGIGDHRALGLGLVLPHKGIDAVHADVEP